MSERETQHQIRRAVRRTLLYLQLTGVPPFATWIAILSLQERENAVVRLFRLDKQEYRTISAFREIPVHNGVYRSLSATDVGCT
jgi:hypothetical protein